MTYVAQSVQQNSSYWLEFGMFVVLPSLGALGLRWLKAKVEASAKAGAELAANKALGVHKLALDKQLADYSGEITRELEAVRNDLAISKERYSKDYALFAERRNAVYGITFRRFEETRQTFKARFGLAGPPGDFRTSAMADIVETLRRSKHRNPSEATALQRAIDAADLPTARSLVGPMWINNRMNEGLGRSFGLRRYRTINALFFSAEVEAILVEANAHFSAIEDACYAVPLVDEATARNRTMVLADISPRLKGAMQAEMIMGFTPRPASSPE